MQSSADIFLSDTFNICNIFLWNLWNVLLFDMSLCVYPLRFEVLRRTAQHLHQAIHVVWYQDTACIAIFCLGVVLVMRTS